MNNFWLKKIGILAGIFILVLLFNLNKSRTYESQTDILLLPKNEIVASGLGGTIENLQQILTSLSFNDRISEKNEALAPSVELPNYKRKEFWNSKLSVQRVGTSGVVRIRNYDADIILAQELNSDTVENLIAVIGSYYNIKTDLEVRIVDGPIVKRIASQNLLSTFGQNIIWSVGLYVVIFFLFPAVFVKREMGKRELPGRDFSRETLLPKKPVPTVLPEEENYFATKNFFDSVPKTEEKKEVLSQKNVFSMPNFPSFGKKAPTPANLPVSEDEVPDIFRQKSAVPKVKKEEVTAPIGEEKIASEYIPREATPEEVKARLNRLLGGGK